MVHLAGDLVVVVAVFAAAADGRFWVSTATATASND